MYFMYVLDPPFGCKSAKHVIKNNKKCIINYKHARFKSLSSNSNLILNPTPYSLLLCRINNLIYF